MSNCVPGGLFFPYFKSFTSVGLDRAVKANKNITPVWRVSAEQNTKLLVVNNSCHCTHTGEKEKFKKGGEKSCQAAVR